MPEAEAENFQIILERVPEERQAEAALFLSGCFSLPPASTRSIAASGPIALLSDLAKEQAEAVLRELLPLMPDGVAMRVTDADERPPVSRLQWPRPPRIYGSKLDEFAPAGVNGSHEAKCPFCGKAVRISPDFKVSPGTMSRHDSSLIPKAAPPLDDRDPLFSGVRPLAAETGKFASIRSLQAGDTGFWLEYTQGGLNPPSREAAASSGADASGAKKSGGKSPAGLAAFMRPGQYALILGRTRDAQAVKMIAEIMGVTEPEARDRGLNLSLCVARNISLDEARNLLSRFRGLGAKARIVRPS